MLIRRLNGRKIVTPGKSFQGLWVVSFENTTNQIYFALGNLKLILSCETSVTLNRAHSGNPQAERPSAMFYFVVCRETKKIKMLRHLFYPEKSFGVADSYEPSN